MICVDVCALIYLRPPVPPSVHSVPLLHSGARGRAREGGREAGRESEGERGREEGERARKRDGTRPDRGPPTQTTTTAACLLDSAKRRLKPPVISPLFRSSLSLSASSDALFRDPSAPPPSPRLVLSPRIFFSFLPRRRDVEGPQNPLIPSHFPPPFLWRAALLLSLSRPPLCSQNEIGDSGWLRLGPWLAGATSLTSLNGFNMREVRGVW
jgi:hypothetical protein